MRKAILTTVGWLLQSEKNRQKAVRHMLDGDQVCVEIMQQDLPQHAVASIIDQMIRDICGAGGGTMLLSFDLPEHGAEVWDVYECRLWADGLRASIESGALLFGATVAVQRGEDVQIMDGARALLWAHEALDVRGCAFSLAPLPHG